MPDSGREPIDFAALARRAGRGLVTATVAGNGRLVALDIPPTTRRR